MLSTTGQSREQLASQMKHLHTLWRNAKLKLMEKDEELDDAKDRIKTLEKAQEGHVSKISALMTVKELSVELQTRHSFATSQLEQMREENRSDAHRAADGQLGARRGGQREREATAQLKAMKSRAERAEGGAARVRAPRRGDGGRHARARTLRPTRDDARALIIPRLPRARARARARARPHLRARSATTGSCARSACTRTSGSRCRRRTRSA